MMKILHGRISSYKNNDSGRNVKPSLTSFKEPKQKGRSVTSTLATMASCDDVRDDFEGGFKSDCDGRLGVEPSDSAEIPDIEVEYGQSKDAISFPDYMKRMPSTNKSFDTSIVKSPSHGVHDQDNVMMVKSLSFGASIIKSRSFLSGIFSKAPSRGATDDVQASPSLEHQGKPRPGFEETIGVAIQASTKRIAKEVEAVNDSFCNHLQTETMSIGIQASPSKIAQGDDPTAIHGNQGVELEVNTQRASNLLTPQLEVDNLDENSNDDASHTSSITDSAAGEPIPKHIDVQKKGLKRVTNGGVKDSKPKKPSKNIFGLRGKGDPRHRHCKKAAVRQSNKNFIGLRHSSKVINAAGNDSKANKPFRASKQSTEDEKKVVDEVKAADEEDTQGKLAGTPSNPSQGRGIHQPVANKTTDDESWSVPTNMDAKTIGSTSLFVATEPREPELSAPVSHEKPVTSMVTTPDNTSSSDTLSSLITSGFAGAMSSGDQWPSLLIKTGYDHSSKQLVTHLSGIADYVKDSVQVEDGIDDIANIVQNEADILGVEELIETPKAE